MNYLTLTRVVFEYKTNNGVAKQQQHLTLTRVVFE